VGELVEDVQHSELASVMGRDCQEFCVRPVG
jgi:hypothetical protein